MRIGDLELHGNVFSAPMAGITDPPFRRMVQRFGVSALWSEMMSAHAVVFSKKLQETAELSGHTAPTFFQIYGKDPEIMAEAARKLQDLGPSGIDLNMGCPVKKVVRKGSGAAMLRDPRLVAQVVAAVRTAIRIPLTVKIRSGWDETEQNAVTTARIIEQEGADAVVLHARSRSKRHSGPASLDLLAEVKQTVRIPVIGNGGVATLKDAQEMLALTGCDGVMIGRGIMGRPWVPGTILRGLGVNGIQAHSLPGPLFDVVREHYRLSLEGKDPLAGVRKMRKHLVWYSRGMEQATWFRCRIMTLDDPDAVLRTARDFFGKVAISYDN